MKRLALALALALPACATIPPGPGTVADRTILDEKIALGAELVYRGARQLAEAGVDAGLLKGERATQVASLDNAAYAALLALRSAYEAGNAPDYLTAASRAQAALQALLAAIGGAR